MSRLILASFAAVLLGAAGSWFWYWDGTPPEVVYEGPAAVRPEQQVCFGIRDAGRGLRRVAVAAVEGGRVRQVAEEDYGLARLPWEVTPSATEICADLAPLELSEGPLELHVLAEDQPNVWLFSRRRVQVVELVVDQTPPRIEVLSRQHGIRQGGAELVVFRVSEEGASGVLVGVRSFRSFPVAGSGGQVRACLFALSHDAPLDTPVSLWAEDPAGNRRVTALPCQRLPGRFRRRKIAVSDAFIREVVPAILQNSGEEVLAGEDLEAFLTVNRRLRERNNAKIAELTREVSPDRWWSGPFRQLTNSQVESLFADYRSYFYRGKKVDEQVHLGFDLASLAHSAVEAANRGKVVFADYLGIYGNTVILDHGWGLYSLYAHLSRIDVEVGQAVEAGTALGLTGRTGLAGGDHLHFSMLVQGVQVNPLEWWDPRWIENHVESKVRRFGDPVSP